MESLTPGWTALVFGASGGIGAAVAARLEAMPDCGRVVTLSRGAGDFDLLDESSIAAAAGRFKADHGEAHLVFDATGTLEADGKRPERALLEIDPAAMAAAFATNAVGPALLFKHFGPLLAPSGKAVFATLSARIGSIGDNRLGGWISYRAAKAALNQIVRTAAVEIARRRPESLCVALHPGTVRTPLSERYAGGRFTFEPDEAAAALLAVLDTLGPEDTGGFFAYDGSEIPW